MEHAQCFVSKNPDQMKIREKNHYEPSGAATNREHSMIARVRYVYSNNFLFILQAYDHHLNMILGDVEETVTTIEIDEETYEEVYRSTKRNIPMLYVRGDSVILVSPPSRSTN